MVAISDFSRAESASLSPAESGLVIKEQVSAFQCETPGRPYLWRLDEATGKALILRPNCKQWSCPHCAEVNRLQWAYKIRYGIEHYESEGDKFWFVTLTTHRSLRSFDKSLAAWRHGWDKLYKRMKRAAVGEMHYVLLPELAPTTGRLHAHMIINQSFGAVYSHTDKKGSDRYKCRWIKDEPAACGLGYMNDIRPVNNAGLASWYVSKYVGKSLTVNNWPEHFRRVRPNINWPEKPEVENEPGGDWKPIMIGQFYDFCERQWQAGRDIINVQTGEMLEIVDIEGNEDENLS